MKPPGGSGSSPICSTLEMCSCRALYLSARLPCSAAGCLGAVAPRRSARSPSTATTSRFPRASRSSGPRGRRWSIGRSSPTSTSKAGSTSPKLVRRDHQARSSGSEDSRIASCGWSDSDGDGKLRQVDRLCRRDDVPRRGDVARRLALRRGAAAASGSSPTPTTTAWPTSAKSGSTARRSPAAPTTCTAPISAPTAGSTGARGPSPSRPTRCRAARPFVTRASHIFRCRPDGIGHRAGDDRRHGQPGRCRLHARRRADLHHHVLPAPRPAACATA